jgi:IS5 family transposase
VGKREEHQDKTIDWAISARPGLVKQWRKRPRMHERDLQLQRIIPSFRVKVLHPFRILKCQFGFTKTRYRGLKKNDNKLAVMFGLANLLHVERLLVA